MYHVGLTGDECQCWKLPHGHGTEGQQADKDSVTMRTNQAKKLESHRNHRLEERGQGKGESTEFHA